MVEPCHCRFVGTFSNRQFSRGNQQCGLSRKVDKYSVDVHRNCCGIDVDEGFADTIEQTFAVALGHGRKVEGCSELLIGKVAIAFRQ